MENTPDTIMMYTGYQRWWTGDGILAIKDRNSEISRDM